MGHIFSDICGIIGPYFKPNGNTPPKIGLSLTPEVSSKLTASRLRASYCERGSKCVCSSVKGACSGPVIIHVNASLGSYILKVAK